jgi:hypothetical protein
VEIKIQYGSKMSNFYYKVGGVVTRDPWVLPNFNRIRKLMIKIISDPELSDFDIYLGGGILKKGISWDIKIFLEFENWETSLNFNLLESTMSKIYRIGFNENLLIDVTFCGSHQFDDLWIDAQSREFLIPNYNHSQFIKFEETVKSVDGESIETLISDNYDVEFITDSLVRFDNIGKKYSQDLINNQVNWIFKEGLLVETFLSLSLNQFESLKY